MAAKKITTKIKKSAIDGRFVSDAELKKHPKTTFQQTVTKPSRKSQKKG